MKKAVNKISVFNLMKGIGILLVILVHAKLEFMNRFSGVSELINHLIDSYTWHALMCVFFMLSGYYTRKQPVKKYLKHQVNLLLKPYAVTACITMIFIFIRNLAMYHVSLRMVKDTGRNALAFLLGVAPSGLQYFRLQYTNCGPVWFLLALMIGTTLFFWLQDYVDEKKRLWIFAVIFLLHSPLLYFEKWIPFSLSRGIYAFLPLSIGYWMKKQKVLDKPLPKYHWLLGALLFLGLFGVETGYVVNVLLQLFFTAFGGFYIAFLTIYLFCYCGDTENWLIDKLEYIGRNSLIFFCVHTVEYKSLPWGMLSKRFMNRPVLGTFVLFALEAFISVAGSVLILNRKTLWKKFTKYDVNIVSY